MPSKNTKQSVLENRLQGSTAATANAVRKSGKTTGTRWGVLDDWREGGAKGPVENQGVGKRLRDGR
jgi:hypothetical protein